MGKSRIPIVINYLDFHLKNDLSTEKMLNALFFLNQNTTIEEYLEDSFNLSYSPASKASGEVANLTVRKKIHNTLNYPKKIQTRIAQLVAYRLGSGEVLGSNPSNGKNFSMKISN